MTPQERKLVSELFDRLATLEDHKRDPEAERLVAEGMQRAPNAGYALAQTVLLQDEALRNADARIRELEGNAGESGGFLDNMRDSLSGGRERPRGSVPPVRPEGAPIGVPPGFRTGAATDRTEPQQGAALQQGGSFLGTAAAAAAGVIGGALLLDGIRSMMGGKQGTMSEQATANRFGNTDELPWNGKNEGGELSREAGLDNIGKSGDARTDAGEQQSYDMLAGRSRRQQRYRHRSRRRWRFRLSRADIVKRKGRRVHGGLFYARRARRSDQITMTLVPTFTRSYRSMTSSLRMRMQPDDTAWPIVQGSFEPWMR